MLPDFSFAFTDRYPLSIEVFSLSVCLDAVWVIAFLILSFLKFLYVPVSIISPVDASTFVSDSIKICWSGLSAKSFSAGLLSIIFAIVLTDSNNNFAISREGFIVIALSRRPFASLYNPFLK